MPDDLLDRLRRFHAETFPADQRRYEQLAADGQHPTTLFIGCSDSRLVPYLLTDAAPGELFMVRNVGAFVPPYDGYLDELPGDPPPDDPGLDDAQGAGGPASAAAARQPRRPARRWVGYHGTAAAIEFAVLTLNIARIVVCGHSHCGAIRALYGETPEEAPHLAAWLRLGREAVLPVAVPGPEALRRTEQRAVVIQLERLMAYPMVRRQVEARALTLHGWHYVIEDGEVHVFDVLTGSFMAASQADHSGTGPYVRYEDEQSTAPGNPPG